MYIRDVIAPENRHILAVTISEEKAMLIVERFISLLTNQYRKHPTSIDGSGTW